MARPSKLNPTIQKKICDLLARGVTIENCASAVGIAVPTFYLWLDIGNSIINESPHDRKPKSKKAQKSYVEFVETTTQARNEALQLAEEVAFSGLESQTEYTKQIDEVIETRIGKDGKPYEHKKKTSRIQERVVPPDARYALEYLWRRNPEKWAKVQKNEHTGKDGGSIEYTLKYPDE